MAAYTTVAAGDWTAEATWHAGGPTAGYCTPGMSQPITSTSSGTGGGVLVTLTTAPDASSIWVAGNIAYISGVATGTEANGNWAAVNISGATFEIVPRKEVNWAAGGTQTATRTSDSAVGTVIGTTAVSGGIQLTLSGVATTWAVGDEVTVSGVLGTTNANGVWKVRAATNVTNSTIDLAVKYVAAGSGGTVIRGDTATISKAVTIGTTVITGTSPVTNAAVITINNNGTSTTGSLTIQDGGSLTVRGGITTAGSSGAAAFIVVEDGGTLIGDSTYAMTQIRYDYRFNSAVDYIDFTGTVGNRATLTGLISAMPNVSGTPAALASRFRAITGEPRIKARFTDFTDVGGLTTTYAGSGMVVDFQDCTFAGSGTWYHGGGLSATATWRVNRCKFTGSIAQPLTMLAWNTPVSGGVREITDNVFDLGVTWGCADITVSGNIISGYHGNVGTVQTTGPGVISDSLYILPYQTSGCVTTSRIVNCYVLGINQSRNARGFQTGSAFSDPTPTTPMYDQLIFDYPNISSIAWGSIPTDTDTGDLIQTPSANPSTTITTTIANSIGLPISSGHSAESYASRGVYPGTMFTTRGNTNTVVRAYNNTWHVNDLSATLGSHGALNIAESATARVGECTHYYNNLAWSPTTTGIPHIYDDGHATVNSVTPGNCNHNASWNLITHSQTNDCNGKHYYFEATGGTVGTGDITNVDPQFVDKDRCFVKWVRLLRGDLGVGAWSSGKRSDETYTDEQTIVFGLAEMRKMLDSDFDSRYTIAALQAYVRAGFAPTNPTYQNSDQAGTGTIGAVDGVFGGVPLYLETSLTGSFQSQGF